ncbi:MAG: threonylcarbamoyl-AMP synthase [Candidatus Omnitrophica bacterium]|nr:threonylcarbamoyl-AMP synthase [Candidatus Omnitrophota bacterium]
MRKKTKVFKIDPDNPQLEKIAEAAEILKAGGIAAFPTETVYGLAVVASNDNAVNKLKKIKGRDHGKKFSICIHSFEQAEGLTGNIPPFAYRLMKKFWPGPITLVLESKDSDSVGLRMPDHGVTQILLKYVGDPVFAPSANLSGCQPAVSAEDVLKNFDGKIDVILDAGKAKWEISSTVCRVFENSFEILRPGVITDKMINVVLRDKNVLFVCTGNSCRSAMAEGLMKKISGFNPHLSVHSAGIAAFENMPATKEAVAVMKQSGIDISEHRTKRLTDVILKEADYILVMDYGHRRYILNHMPQVAKRVFLLKEFSGAKEEEGLVIPDPIGMQAEYYLEISNILKQSIEKIVEKIQ